MTRTKNVILMFIILITVSFSYSAEEQVSSSAQVDPCTYQWASCSSDGTISLDLAKAPEGSNNIPLKKDQTLKLSDGQIYKVDGDGSISLNKEGGKTIIDSSVQLIADTDKGRLTIGPSKITITDDGYNVELKEGSSISAKDGEGCSLVQSVKGKGGSVSIDKKQIQGDGIQSVEYGNFKQYNTGNKDAPCGPQTSGPVTGQGEVVEKPKGSEGTTEKPLEPGTAKEPTVKTAEDAIKEKDDSFTKAMNDVKARLESGKITKEQASIESEKLLKDYQEYYSKMSNTRILDPITSRIDAKKYLLENFLGIGETEVNGMTGGEIHGDSLVTRKFDSFADDKVYAESGTDLERRNNLGKDTYSFGNTELIAIKNPTDPTSAPFVYTNVEKATIQMDEDKFKFSLASGKDDSSLLFPNTKVDFNGMLTVEVDGDTINIRGDDMVATTGEETVIGDASIIVMEAGEMRHVGIGENARYELQNYDNKDPVAVYNLDDEWHQLYLIKSEEEEHSEICDHCSYLNFINNSYLSIGDIRIERKSVVGPGWDTVIDSRNEDNIVYLQMDDSFDNADMFFKISGVDEYNKGQKGKCEMDLEVNTYSFYIEQCGTIQYANNADIPKDGFIRSYNSPYGSKIYIDNRSLNNSNFVLNAQYYKETSDPKDNMWTRLSNNFKEIISQVG